jgi:hypothetical protein
VHQGGLWPKTSKSKAQRSDTVQYPQLDREWNPSSNQLSFVWPWAQVFWASASSSTDEE